MRALITGKGGKSGSWLIRGLQLGQAIGAEVSPMADERAIDRADIVVVVKRTPDVLIDRIRASGKPWVLDIIDGWSQPAGNAWTRTEAVRWLRDRLAHLKPTAVVFPTTRMMADSAWQGPSFVLPHHAWPKYKTKIIRQKVARVGYEGAADYLGSWKPEIEFECKRRGWEFVVNGDLASCDIGLALRDVSGYPAGAWKANTKIANLQALGIPAICSPEESYREFGSGSELFVTDELSLSEAFDKFTDYGERLKASIMMQPPTLEQVAQEYRRWLASI